MNKNAEHRLVKVASIAFLQKPVTFKYFERVSEFFRSISPLKVSLLSYSLMQADFVFENGLN